MRSLRIIACLGLVLLTLGTTLQPARAAQNEPAPTDPLLFDLELAQANLDAINAEVDRIRRELDEVLGMVDGLVIARDFIDLNNQARNEVLQESRTRARNMAVNTYVGAGPPLQGIALLNAQSANDLTYRNSLLRQQTERLQQAALTYSIRAGDADANVLELADSINDEIRQAEALSRDLARQVELVPEAEWFVKIAQIHRDADVIFERKRRPEPTAEQWRKLRFCESTETYSIDTGNTFYGAYQFTWETWGTVGGNDNPALAPAAEQDARARLLYADRGSQPWPVCGRFLP